MSIIKISMRRWALLMTLLLLSELLQNVNSAPTKHLKVTAEGDIPKLIVTSEEDFGTGPKRLVAAKYKPQKTTKMSTPNPMKFMERDEKTIDEKVIKKDEIPNEQRQAEVTKNISTNVDFIKIQTPPATASTSTLSMENPSNFIYSGPTTTSSISITTGNEQDAIPAGGDANYAHSEQNQYKITTTIPMIKSIKTSVLSDAQTTLEPIKQSEVKYTTQSNAQEVEKDIIKQQFKVKESEKNIKLYLATTESPLATITVLEMIENSTRVGKLPLDKFQHQQTAEAPASDILMPATVTKHGELLIVETEKNSTPTMKKTLALKGEDEVNTSNTGFLNVDKQNEKVMSYKQKQEIQMVGQHMSEVEISMAHKTVKTTTTTPQMLSTITTITSTKNIKSTPTVTTSAVDATKESVIITPTDVVKQDMKTTTATTTNAINDEKYNKSNAATELTGKTLTSSDISQKTKTTATTSKTITSNMDIMLNEQPDEDSEVKLIDLEKLENKSAELQRKEILLKQKYLLPHKLQTKDSEHIVDDADDGHDGVKKTKKKQLQIDKHLLADIGISTSEQPPPTPTPLRRTTSTTKYSSKIKSEIGSISSKVKKSGKQTDEVKQFMVSLKTAKEITKPTEDISEQLGALDVDREIYNVKSKKHETYIESHFSNEDKKPLTYAATNSATKKKNKEKKKKFKLQLTTTDSPYFSTVSEITTTQLESLSGEKPSCRTTVKPQAVTRKVLAERTESKISDIQVEVYDSTVDSIVSSNNFKDNASNIILQEWYTLASTKKPTAAATLQERFTQYVVDSVESSTQVSNLAAKIVSEAYDKPEPAAIEIHINVSEGVGNGSEDLEFSYPQLNYENNEKFVGSKGNLSSKSSNLKPHAKTKNNNDETQNISDEDEVLVVEIIDTGDNNTANSASSENINPIFTFRSVANGNEVEFKNDSDGILKTSIPLRTSTDELFMANMQKYVGDSTASSPPPLPPANVRKPTIDHDSDTIFYISNTEVKVGESLPTSNINSALSNTEQKYRHPSAYVLSTYPNLKRHRFEEDILLSPIQNTADSLKIFRSENEADAPPLDVTYVAESVMKVEQLPPANEKESQNYTIPQVLNNSTNIQTPGQVIIQPATLSEIGLPVIGEMPPQIKLKEFDFMPDELTNHEQPSASYSATIDDGAHEEEEDEEEEEEHVNINDVERLVESSIQYGGDLIDEGAVGGGAGGGGSSFDGVEGSYPFANLATMGRHGRKNVKSKYAGAHSVVNHGINNLLKNVLSVDMAESGSRAGSNAFSRDVNGTIKENKFVVDQNVDGDAASLNITYAIAERMINATAASLMENPQMTSMNIEEDYYWSIFTLTASTIIAIMPVVTILSMFFALRYYYIKYHLTSNDSSENDYSPEGGNDGKTINGNDGDDDADGDNSESTELQTSSSSDKPYQNQSSSSNNNNANRSLSSVNEKNPFLEPSSYANENQDVELAEIHNYTSYMANDNSVASTQCSSVPKFKFNSPNGSVIKMTLKNNHLIVETEQRNDISRNMRETKMHYNNATGRDGVFVVEVSRGIDSQHLPEIPITDREQCFMHSIISNQQQRILLLEKNEKFSIQQKEEEVQIHQPPRDMEKTEEKSQIKLQQIVEVEEECSFVKQSYTGLSQSDLSTSSSSSAGSNKCYNYGNQSLYTDDLNSKSRKITTVENNLQVEDAKGKANNGQHIEMGTTKAEIIETNEKAANSKSEVVITNNNKTDVDVISNETKAETKLIKDIMATTDSKPLYATEVVDMTEKVVSRIEEEVENTMKSLNEELPKMYTASDLLQNVTNEKSSFNEATFKNEMKLQNNEDKVSSDNNITAEIDIIEVESTSEKGYDSLMSLPEPPSFDEIKQLNDCNPVDNNQLDSLTLPPPPPAFFMAELQVQKEELLNNQQSIETIEVIAKNDRNGQQSGPPEQLENRLSDSIELKVNNDIKMLSAQLTPPESPPGINCNNGLGNGLRHKGGICAPLSAQVAVDVNGS